MEYPKSLYRGSVDDHVIVKDAAAEKEKREDGYEMYAEIHVRTLNSEALNTETEAPKRGRKPKAE